MKHIKSICFIYVFFTCLLPWGVKGQVVYPHTDYEYVGPEMIPTAPINPTGSTLVESGDLPLTIAASDSDKIFYLDGNVTTTASAIYLSHLLKRIRFNGNGDTVFFGTGNGNATSGLGTQLWSTITDIHFQNTSFYHNPSDTSADSTYAFSLITNYSKRLRFDTCNFHVFGKRDSSTAGEAQAVSDQGNAGANQQSIMFFGGKMTATVWGYESRGNEDGFTVVLKENWDGIDHDSMYHYIFHDVNVEGVGGLSLEGRTWVSACSIFVDAQNLRYQYPTGNSYQGCANQAGLASGDAFAPSRWTNNYIVAGYDNQGMDEGIILDGACRESSVTDEDSLVQIDSNYINVHFRVDPHYGINLYAKPTTFRFGNRDGWVHHNTFILEVGDTNSDSAWGPNGWLLKYNASPDIGDSHQSDSNFTYENNYHETVAKTATLTMGQQEFSGMTFNVDDDGDSAEYVPSDYDVVFRYNYIKTPERAYSFGSTDGSCQHMQAIYGDTVEFFWADPFHSQTHYTAANDPSGYGAGNLGYYNYVQDVVYVGIGEPDSLVWLYPGYTHLSVGLKRTVTLYVRDGEGNPVNAADFWAVNAYGDTVISTTTNGSGIATGVVKYWDIYSDFDDSTAYNDFTLGAQKTGDSATTTFTVGWDTHTDTLTLSPAETTILKKVKLKGVKLGG